MIFWLCYEGPTKPKPWSVRLGKRWTWADEADIRVPSHTVYRGPTSPQPKAYVTGKCDKVALRNGVVVIQ